MPRDLGFEEEIAAKTAEWKANGGPPPLEPELDNDPEEPTEAAGTEHGGDGDPAVEAPQDLDVGPAAVDEPPVVEAPQPSEEDVQPVQLVPDPPVTQRHRQKQATKARKKKMPKGIPSTREDIPVDEILEAKTSYDTAKIRVSRRNDKGQIATVYGNVIKTLDELLEIDSWLSSMAGGGRFRIEARDPQNPAAYVCPSFYVTVEGAPHKPRYLGNPVDSEYHNPVHAAELPLPGGAQPMNQPYGPPPPSPWSQGLHPQARAVYNGRPGGHAPAPGATVASDQIAMRELAEMKAKLAKVEAELKAGAERHDIAMSRKREELQKEREDAREARHRADMEALRMEMAANRTAPTPPAAPMQGLVEMLVPLAPVLTALIGARESSSSKSLEMQQSGMKTLMEASLKQSNRPDESMEMFKNVMLPMIMKQMDARGPEGQAKLYNAVQENSLNSIAMMAQLIEAFAANGDDKPWYFDMIQTALGGIVGATEAYMTSDGLAGPSKPARQLTAQPQTAPQPTAPQPQPAGASAPAPIYSTVDDPAAEVIDVVPEPTLEEPISVPKPGLKEAVMLQFLPADFQTPEWKAIILKLHKDDDPNQVINLLVRYIENLIEFDMLPKAIADIATSPEDALQRLLDPLPATKERPDFCQTVYETVITELARDGYVTNPHGDGDGGDDDPGQPAVIDVPAVEVATPVVAVG